MTTIHGLPKVLINAAGEAWRAISRPRELRQTPVALVNHDTGWSTGRKTVRISWRIKMSLARWNISWRARISWRFSGLFWRAGISFIRACRLTIGAMEAAIRIRPVAGRVYPAAVFQ